MIRKVKVLHVIASLGNGGAERQLIELLKRNKDHGVLLLSDADIYKKTLNDTNIKYWEFHIKNKYFFFNKIIKFKAILNEFRPDIIQAWMYNACLFTSLCKLIRIYRVPLIWNIRCSEMVTLHYPISLKLIISFCKLLSAAADKIVYNSYAGLNYHNKIGFCKKNQSIIYNGVDSQRFRLLLNTKKKLRTEYNFRASDLIIICVARVDPMKNHVNLLNAFNKFKLNNNNKNVKLLLIGRETEKLALPTDCLALGMKKKIEIYYNLADIIIVPSAFGEGFSNVLVEGMLTHLLPVATNIGDAKKIIGNTGFIIEGSSSKFIERQIQEITNLNKNIIKRYGVRAKNRAYKMFSIKKMQEAYYLTYEELIN